MTTVGNPSLSYVANPQLAYQREQQQLAAGVGGGGGGGGIQAHQALSEPAMPTPAAPAMAGGSHRAPAPGGATVNVEPLKAVLQRVSETGPLADKD